MIFAVAWKSKERKSGGRGVDKKDIKASKHKSNRKQGKTNLGEKMRGLGDRLGGGGGWSINLLVYSARYHQGHFFLERPVVLRLPSLSRGFRFAAYSSLGPELACPLPLLPPGQPMAHRPAFCRSNSAVIPETSLVSEGDPLASSPQGSPSGCGSCSPHPQRPTLST